MFQTFLILIWSLFWTHSVLWACPGVFTETGEASCRSGWWWTGGSVGRRNNPRCSSTRQLDPRSAGDRTRDTGNVWHTHRWMNINQDPDQTDHLREQTGLLMINPSVVWSSDVLCCPHTDDQLRHSTHTLIWQNRSDCCSSESDKLLHILTVYGLDNRSSVKMNRELKPYCWWDFHKSFQHFSNVSHQINNFPACWLNVYINSWV